MCRLTPLPKILVSKEDIKYFFLSSLQLQWLNNVSDWEEIVETLLLLPDSANQLKINMVDFYVQLDPDYIASMDCTSDLSPLDLKLALIQKIRLMPLDIWIYYQLFRMNTVNLWDLN